MSSLLRMGKRKCDARCYNAKGFVCNCICNGYNHGVGPEIAKENTKFLIAQLTDYFYSMPNKDGSICWVIEDGRNQTALDSG